MKIALILLASGGSKRFGENKLLYKIDGVELYRYIIDATSEIPFFQKIIVTQYDEILNDELLLDYIKVKNQNPQLGISNSIKLGVEACSDQIDAFCFSVCDQPFMKAETIEGLVKGFTQSGKLIGCLKHGEDFGNPNIFSKCYKQALLELKGGSGAKSIIKSQKQSDIFFYNVTDKTELFDIDYKREL